MLLGVAWRGVDVEGCMTSGTSMGTYCDSMKAGLRRSILTVSERPLTSTTKYFAVHCNTLNGPS